MLKQGFVNWNKFCDFPTFFCVNFGAYFDCAFWYNLEKITSVCLFNFKLRASSNEAFFFSNKQNPNSFIVTKTGGYVFFSEITHSEWPYRMKPHPNYQPGEYFMPQSYTFTNITSLELLSMVMLQDCEDICKFFSTLFYKSS